LCDLGWQLNEQVIKPSKREKITMIVFSEFSNVPSRTVIMDYRGTCEVAWIKLKHG
jgi:hypothetical protein